MRRVAKWVGICFAILFLIVLALPFLINVNQFRPTLQSELSNALGRQVTLGNLKLSILKGEVTADDLAVSEDPAFGKPAFLRGKSLHVGVEIWPFVLSRKLVVTELILDEPQMALLQAPSGAWNFSSLGVKRTAAAAPPSASDRSTLDLSVKLVRISNGRVTLTRTVGHWKPLSLDQLNLELRDFSRTSASPFSISAQVVGGGTLQLDGTAGPVNMADSAMTPLALKVELSRVDLAGSGMNDVAPNVTGIASLDASGTSDGVTMHLQGKLQTEKLKLAKNGTPATRPVALDFAVAHDLRKHSGIIQSADFHIGAATAHLSGSYVEQGQSQILNLKVVGPRMPVQELEAVLPALGVVLPAGTSLQGGTASANLTLQGPSDRLVTSGTLSLNNTRLTAFDLSKKMGTIEKLAGITAQPDTDIQVLSANLRSAPEGTNVQDMRLIVPALGELTGAGTVSPSNQLDFRMTAMVHSSGLMAVVNNQAIPFTITGTSSDPVFRPDMAAIGRAQIRGVEKDATKAATDMLKGFLGGKKH